MARCNDCGKFVSYGEAEPELETAEFSYNAETGEVSLNIDVRRPLDCGECGTELKETTFNFEQEIDGVLLKGLTEDDIAMDVEVSNQDKTEGKGRGMKMFYGVEIAVSFSIIEKGAMKELHNETFDEYCQASHYEEL